ncbi:MAG: carbon storage regulator [Planctomycetaceae bacterium]
MLVLSRENIVITVVEIRGDKVRLGIQAPKEIPIHRNEIYEAICNERAAQSGAEQTASESRDHVSPTTES